jgi:beta-lactamase superfamily II metal-dependent hydrolase
VYVYNVLFGDAILVEVPDAGQRRFVLIDVGNVIAGKAGADEPLLTVVEDVIARTGGVVDLYVMTHEHLDHVQGLLYAADHGRRLGARSVWMTASAAPDYYERHSEARRRRTALQSASGAFEAVLGTSAWPPGLAGMHALNLAHPTSAYVDHIRSLTPRPHYVHRESDLAGTHPFRETELRLLAPEEDTSVYYRRVRAHVPSPQARGATRAPTREGTSATDSTDSTPLVPPTGVDGSAFFDLVASMNGGLAESLLSLDKASNNTSLVLELVWRGRRLLFAGDAEQESWRLMVERDLLQPVDFLKVAHHGSRTGRPPAEALDRILPASAHASAVAVLSSHETEHWKGVPDADAVAELEQRTSTLYRTDSVEPGTPVVIEIAPAVPAAPRKRQNP